MSECILANAAYAAFHDGECVAWISLTACLVSLATLAALTFFRCNKTARLAISVWNVVAVVCSVVVLVLHACVFSIVATVFAALMCAFALAIFFRNEKPQFSLGSDGAYVVFERDGKVELLLFDNQNKLLAKSPVLFDSAEDAKRYAAKCIAAAKVAVLRDGENVCPAFEPICSGDEYFCQLVDDRGETLLVSPPSKTPYAAKCVLASFVGAVLSTKLLAAFVSDDF